MPQASTTRIVSETSQRLTESLQGHQSDDSVSDEVVAAHLLARRAGLKAKCSFLLSVLASETTTAADRAGAFVGLVDDLDKLGPVLDGKDHLRLREVVESALPGSAAEADWSVTCYPDASVTDPAAIDGTQVQRVVVPAASATAASATAATLDIARVEIPAGTRAAVISEYTCLSHGQAAIVAVDQTGDVLAESRLAGGLNRLSTMIVALDARPDPAHLTIRVENDSREHPVLWYQTTVHSLADRASTPSVSERLHRALNQQATAPPPSVFAPITKEPLRLDDIDRLMSLRDKFRGERIFIMGNGPSLNRTPLELLADDYVFGVNRVSLLFDRLSWRPTFFTAFDIRVVPDNREEFAELDIPYKFFSARYKKMLGERPNHYWYHTKGFYEGFEAAFEPTVVYSGFGGGGTIGVIAIELAFFLGFRDIYLIGTDVSYSVPKTVKQSGEDGFGDGVKLELESTADDDQNHFDPRYFGRGKKWHSPNVRDMKIGFARAAAYIERRGGVLRNATVGGELDEVERVAFESLF